MSMINRLSEGKVSTAMKDALIRNNIAEQKMKSSLTSLGSVSKKEVHSLEYQKALYEKRQSELKRSLAVDQDGVDADRITLHRGMSPSPRPDRRYDRSRSPSPRPDTRYDRSRSPSPRPDTRYDRSRSPSTRPDTRYERSRSPSPRPDPKPRPTSSINRKFSEPPRFTTVTELNNQWRNGKGDVRPRSISLISAPSIQISEAADDSSMYPRVKLPPISSSPSGLKAEVLTQQRRKSTGELPLDAGRVSRRSSLTPSPEPRATQSSPVLSRKLGIRSPGTQLPRGMTRKDMSDELRGLSGILKLLDDVQQKKVPDLDCIDMRSSPSVVERNSQENLPMKEENVHNVVAKENGERDGRKQLKKNKMSDVVMSESLDDDDDLASSMDKLKFCTYLRRNDVNLDNEQNLPDELVPRSMIIGHTKTPLN